MKKLILFAFVIFIIQPSSAQLNIKRPDGGSMTASSIDRIVHKLMDTAEVTGLCIGIINNNQPVDVKAYGYANKATGQKNDTATNFYAASLSKALFAYTVVQLAQDGVIDLDKPLYTYLPKPLPDYEAYKELAGDERWKLITARDCLRHTTGFPNWRSTEPNGSPKMGIYFRPGSHYAYSGEGIQLLQMVIEAITRRSLEDIAREKIFVPFGMTKSSYLWQPRFENDFAVGHNIAEDTIHKDRYKNVYAAGSMETTIADYTRFISAVLQHKKLTDKYWNQIFSPQIVINSKTQMFSLDTTSIADNSKIQLAYGLGWGLFQTPYGRAFFKEGHGFGWQHYMIAIPQQKTALIIMSNSDNAESIFTELVQKLTGVTIPYEWESYHAYRGTTKLTDEQLKQFTGVWHNERYDATISLVNGKLKVEAPKVGLPPTNIYPQNDHHLFLKIMEADFEFVKGPNGKFDKAVADDEGEHYELTRVK
ncbi:serine hydrolase domain-containing protein [Mucilaginibacter sp.]|jgi:CubicO group peptidase (beta-lactamase class C family)|uniref:serine hydrolase domain-containing protein n=1 Tax=Mucilaginibacter sp. TaxID=1882438 RepID=UPI002CACC00C|nr:serine hydrolase domain-containing protein [Mucilaginibacter sp.]HTI57850.1 serine hydrolase domain-containing protein [Mucilaginibacter sp.]